MKVLIVGDSPFISTGFGRVNRIAANAFKDAGYTVGAVSGLSMDVVDDTQGIQMWYPEQGDILGVLSTIQAIQEFQPDLVYHTGEPGTLTAFSKVVPARLPFVAYVPIEGEPIIKDDWKQVLKGTTVFTCSEYGVGVLERIGLQNVEWAYHGVDHEAFKVNGRREEVRKALNWNDKFVLMTVATNVKRKQWPRLIEALSLLKHHYKQKDIILYAHTIPFDGHWLEGWNLPEIAMGFGVYPEVVFNPALTGHNASIPDVGLYDGLGLVDLYNAADLFVLPSQVEGFGLPIAEAMACGLPVLVTKYAAGWEVARPAGYGIPVKDWETHKSGTRYANVDTELLAKEILRIRRNPRERVQRIEAGLRRVRDFHWEDFTEKLVAISDRAIKEKGVPQEVSTGDGTQEPEDQGQVTSTSKASGNSGNSHPSEDRPTSEQADDSNEVQTGSQESASSRLAATA